jgi:hypothetical protein
MPICLFTFTGHGALNRRNANNNAMLLWEEEPVSVKEFSNLLDQLPEDKTVTTMMAQCFSGSFANFVYKDGNPKQPLPVKIAVAFSLRSKLNHRWVALRP